MNFCDQFLECLVSKRDLTPSISINKYLPDPITISETAKNELFYLQAIGEFEVSYPYYYEMLNLDSYMLLYTYSGEGLLNYNEQEYSLLPGTICFIHCTIRHKVKLNNSAHWRFSQIFLNGNSCSYYFKEYTRYNTLVYPLERNSTTLSILKNIREYYNVESILSELILSKLITDLLTELLIDIEKNRNSFLSVPKYIIEIKQLFDNEFDTNFSLDELALRFNKNKYKLSKDFTFYIKKSPIDYLITRRIEAAKQRLWDTNETIGEVGIAVGIENTNHFINTFKKQTGMTPLKFRNQRPF